MVHVVVSICTNDKIDAIPYAKGCFISSSKKHIFYFRSCDMKFYTDDELLVTILDYTRMKIKKMLTYAQHK